MTCHCLGLPKMKERQTERGREKHDNESYEEAYHADTNKYTLNDEQIMRSHQLYVPGEYVCIGLK